MRGKLLLEALFKFALGLAAVMLLLFLPAGSWAYMEAWRLLGLLFVPMFVVGLLLLWKDPELLQKRLHARESRQEQSLVIRLSGLLFVASFAQAGLSFRLGWLLPDWVSGLGCVLFILSYGFYGFVLRENRYLSRKIEIQEGQQLVDTGLYGLVRHPMYSATVLLFLSMPLVLASGLSLVPLLFYPLLIVRRIRDEETLLEQELPSYRDYERRVPWRLIPYIW